MIIVKAVIPGQNVPLLDCKLTKIGETRHGETYHALVMQRPDPTNGLAGFEVDMVISGFKRSLGITPLLAGILGHADQVPLDYEPSVDIKQRLILRDMAAFNARIKYK